MQLVPYRVPFHTEMECGVPFTHAVDVIKQLNDMVDKHHIAVNFIFEIRQVMLYFSNLSSEFEHSTDIYG